MTTIAFLGLGRMGTAMATRLLTVGHEVHVYNRTKSRADALAEKGARIFDSPKDASQGAAAVISMVADDAASRAMWLGSDGVLASDLAADALLIECSTLSHEWVLELSALCKDRGFRYVDAPVTGLPEAAAAGELTLLVGGAPADIDAARHLLASLANRVLTFGPVGAGTAYKLIINLMGAVQIAGAAEGVAIAERAGLDVSTVVAAIATSQAASPQVVRNTRRMAMDDHAEVVFSAALRLKDVEYALRFARSLGMDSSLGSVAEAIYRRLCALGHAQMNESKVIEACRAAPMD